jgi:hypothetical protein
MSETPRARASRVTISGGGSPSAGRRARRAAPVEDLQRALAARNVAAPVRAAGHAAGDICWGRCGRGAPPRSLLWPRPVRCAFALGAEGAEGCAGRTIEARADSELPLRFSDGSSVTFQPGSSGRVQRLTAPAPRWCSREVGWRRG